MTSHQQFEGTPSKSPKRKLDLTPRSSYGWAIRFYVRIQWLGSTCAFKRLRSRHFGFEFPPRRLRMIGREEGSWCICIDGKTVPEEVRTLSTTQSAAFGLRGISSQRFVFVHCSISVQYLCLCINVYLSFCNKPVLSIQATRFDANSMLHSSCQ